MLRGVMAVIFALLAFIWPAITLSVLVVFLGAYLFVDGLFTLVYGFQVLKKDSHWWVLVLEGLLGMAAGMVALFMPAITAVFLVTLIAIWAVVTGILEIILAIRLRKEITNEWMLAIAGVFSVIFGILLIAQPIAGVVVIAWWLGIYALFFGVFLVSVGLRLKKIKPAI